MEDLHCIVLSFVIHAEVMENNHGKECLSWCAFCFCLSERDRAVFVRGDFSPKTGLMGEKLGTENGDFSEAD